MGFMGFIGHMAIKTSHCFIQKSISPKCESNKTRVEMFEPFSVRGLLNCRTVPRVRASHTPSLRIHPLCVKHFSWDIESTLIIPSLSWSLFYSTICVCSSLSFGLLLYCVWFFSFGVCALLSPFWCGFYSEPPFLVNEKLFVRIFLHQSTTTLITRS